jgi:hypothetical protein
VRVGPPRPRLLVTGSWIGVALQKLFAINTPYRRRIWRPSSLESCGGEPKLNRSGTIYSRNHISPFHKSGSGSKSNRRCAPLDRAIQFTHSMFRLRLSEVCYGSAVAIFEIQVFLGSGTLFGRSAFSIVMLEECNGPIGRIRCCVSEIGSQGAS